MVDYLFVGTRFVEYIRPDVWFRVAISTDTVGAMTELIDGLPPSSVITESNQIDVSALPFLGERSTPNFPFFPWLQLEINNWANSWIIGSRGLPGEEPYSNRVQSLVPDPDAIKIRMKPGVYRADSVDPPCNSPAVHDLPRPDGTVVPRRQEHIFLVSGSDNYFDLRGVVIETPVSVESKLSMKAHVAGSWDIDGSNNTFEGGYFRNVTDRPYPDYGVTESEFNVCNDNNTFLNCTFVVKGSVPYGYSDFYGKGGPNFGQLNKHAFMDVGSANNTVISGCKVYMQSFGHCFHLHNVDGVRIEKCIICGTLRPTNDIYNEVAGRAKDYNYNIMYRGPRPIPHDDIIPLTEDGIRAYDNVRNITVVDTTLMRARGCFQLLGPGNYTLDNVTVREAGDFSYDVSAGSQGKVVMKNCKADMAYNPVFNLTRGETANTQALLTSFDIYASVGEYQATVRQFTVTADSTGKIVVSFSKVTGSAAVCGIELH